MEARWNVTIAEPLDFTGATHRRLEEAGCRLILGRAMWEEPERPYTEDELLELCRDADAVMGASRDRYTRRLFASLPRLLVVSKYGIGTERIDVEAATESGVLVTHTPVAENVASVAEHALTLMLALMRRIKPLGRYLLSGGWRGPATVNHDLRGKTVGIIGLGRIGRELCRLLAPWRVGLLAHDPYADPAAAEEVGAHLVALDTLLADSDVVSLHVVITPETRGMIGAAELARMKPTAFLVNTSRGEAVDEAALAEALTAGRLAGAALDVFHPEPPALTNPLLGMDNVIVTPHVAGFSLETTTSIVEAATENLLAALSGGTPPHVKNPEVLARWRGQERSAG